MSKSSVSSCRKTFLSLGVVLFLAVSGFVASAQAQRVIRATTASVNPGNQVTIQIQLDSQGNESSTSFSFNFNPTVLTNPTVTLGNGVPASSNLGLNTNNAAAGQIGVLVDSTNTYTAGTRNVVNVTFTVPANATLGLYPVTLGSVPTPQSVSSAQGALLTTTYTNGSIQIGSSAAGVDISGRVVTPDGRGIRNASVFITDAAGVRRQATTSSFGIYRFGDVESGKTYTISVASKQYRFTPRIIQVVDTLTDFDFVGQQ
ncbi:MAG: carboxypeptidase regulatory-like domain-containing protein [Pyrinomonadaceae bacterium]